MLFRNNVVHYKQCCYTTEPRPRIFIIYRPGALKLWYFSRALARHTRVAMKYKIYSIAGQTRVAMKYKIYSMAHAVRVGLSEMQWKIALSRGTNSVFWLDNLNFRYNIVYYCWQLWATWAAEHQSCFHPFSFSSQSQFSLVHLWKIVALMAKRIDLIGCLV